LNSGQARNYKKPETDDGLTILTFVFPDKTTRMKRMKVNGKDETMKRGMESKY